MNWFDDESYKDSLRGSETRQQWLDEGASARLAKIWRRLPPVVQSKDRLGPLLIDTVAGAEGNCCWMMPLDGSQIRGKLLGPKNRIKLIDFEGTVFFEGLWEETTKDIISSHEQFFIWLEPRAHTH